MEICRYYENIRKNFKVWLEICVWIRCVFVFDKPLLICIMTTTILAIHSINAKYVVLKLRQKIFIEKQTDPFYVS